MQTQLDTQGLELTKIRELSSGVDRAQKAIDRLTQECEYNQNHYALVENYVEKYLPITT